MSPKGVEHTYELARLDITTRCRVHPSMSPKGVEHGELQHAIAAAHQVHPSMSPKGVEHTYELERLIRRDRASINVAERR